MEGGELLHQAQGGGEGAGRLAARVAQRPQPGDVNVGVAGGDEVGVERRAGGADALLQDGQRGGYGRVEGVAKRFAAVEAGKGGVEGVQQTVAGGIVGVEQFGRLVRRAGQGHKLPRRPIDLHHSAAAHEQAAGRISVVVAQQPRPAVEGQGVAAAVARGVGQGHLLVVAVYAGPGDAVERSQRLGVGEVARLAQRQMQGHGRGRVEVGRHDERAAQHKVHIRPAPIAARRDGNAIAGGLGRVRQRPSERPQPQRLQLRPPPVDQRRDPLQGVANRPRRPAPFVFHRFP